jgi:hypothetical protein
MADDDALPQSLRTQARVCAGMGSPFSAGLLDHAAEDVAGGGSVARILSAWDGAPLLALLKDAVPLRWLGATHDLALSGEDPDVRAAWPVPGEPPVVEAAWSAIAAAMEARPERFIGFVAHEPQTNETRRSACLLGGFLEAARWAGGVPLRTWELGASAGLNQLWDRYRYELGPGGVWGDPGAPVRIDTEWRGPPAPLHGSAQVAGRTACDRAPVDVGDPLAVRRLRAYVWADQFDRLDRLDAAVALAREAGVKVEAVDALAFVQDRVALEGGCLTVIYHSIFWQYLPAQTQQGLEQAIAELGARATTQAPLAWLRMEPKRENLAEIEVRLTLWPSGADRRLALCDPHGRWVEWEES